MPDPALPRVGFIGLGIMGGPMAGHLRAAGHPLTVFNRSPARAAPLLAAGADGAASPAEVTQGAAVVVTMLGMPADVEATWLGPDGLIANAAPGTVLVDMTTSSPSLARRLAEAAAERGLGALDAPVSGGESGARNATLSIMVGGAAGVLDVARPVLARMGRGIVHMGGPGAGQHTKMANQILASATLMGVAEGLAYARAAGLDDAAVLAAVTPGAARSFQLEMLGPKMLAGDFAPGFMVKHFFKDLSIAVAEAEAMRLDLPGLAAARALLQRAKDAYGPEAGSQSVFRLYEAAR